MKETENTRFRGLNKILRSQFVQVLWDKWSDGTFDEFLDDWKWIFSYSRKYWKSIVFYMFLGILSATLSLVSSVASKHLVDIITKRELDKLWILILAMLFSTVFSLVFSSLVSHISTKISIQVNNDIQADIFSRIISADWMALHRFPNGDLLNRFNSDVNTISGNAISWLPNLVISVYAFVSTFVVILYYDVTMAFIALLSAPFLLLASRYIMRRHREYRRRVMELNSNMMSFEVDTFYNLDTIKSFGVTEKYGKELHKWQEKFKEHSLAYNLFTIKSNAITSAISTMVTFLSFGYCLFRLWSGAITYGTMTLFLQQRAALSSKFSSLVGIFPTMLNASISAHRIRQIVEIPEERINPEAAASLREQADDGLTVQMNSVYFSYEDENKVITNSYFVARPGEIVALVGPSGEGKTTMIRLILGLTHPENGTVTLTAADGQAMEMSADLRQFFSYVPQGNTMLAGTIAENLRMVKEDATDEEIIEALKMACAWDFVAKLPDTIHSPVGERGRGLSEGQAQRIAIARAILRDAPVLLLDEATSALDVATERQVLRNIVRQRPNRTCIVTTHRPSVLNMCQRVYRVMQTRVRELTEEESSRMAMDF